MKIHCLSVCFIESICIFSKFKIDNAGGFFYPLVQLFLSHVEYEKHTGFLAENNDG